MFAQVRPDGKCVLSTKAATKNSYHAENLHRSLFLRDLLLDGDKILKVLAI